VSGALFKAAVALPLFYGMLSSDVAWVVEMIREVADQLGLK